MADTVGDVGECSKNHRQQAKEYRDTVGNEKIPRMIGVDIKRTGSCHICRNRRSANT